MERAYKFRIYPNQQQRLLLAKTFGCCRFVYNYYLNKKIELYEKLGQQLWFNACCKDLTLLKQEFEWLKEPDLNALQHALKNLDWSYKKFLSERIWVSEI